MERTTLTILPSPDGKKYILMSDYEYEINGYKIIVPKGFTTDLASVPRIFWTILPPFGSYTKAAIVHDFLYSEKNETGINRTLADKIFLFIMEELGVNKFVRKIMYRGVRSFGEMAWKKKLINEGYNDKALVDKTDEALLYYKKWDKIIKL